MTNTHYCIREPTSSRILITSRVNISQELIYYQPLGLCRFSSHDRGVHPSSGCFLHDCQSAAWMREKRRIRRLHLTYHTFTPHTPVWLLTISEPLPLETLPCTWHHITIQPCATPLAYVTLICKKGTIIAMISSVHASVQYWEDNNWWLIMK